MMCYSFQKNSDMFFFSFLVKSGNRSIIITVSIWCLFFSCSWMALTVSLTKISGIKDVVENIFVWKKGKFDELIVSFEWIFLPVRLRSDRHIAQVFLSLFMLHYFSMSWNAMFLVLLTLYSVKHFIINSLPIITASVLIEEKTPEILGISSKNTTWKCTVKVSENY